MRKKRGAQNKGLIRRIIFLNILAGIGIAALFLGSASAIDGSGANSVAPSSALINSTGNTLNFTFTAAETMDSGGFSIVVPSNWTAPQAVNSLAGYTTASSSAGIVADVVNSLDVKTGWATTTHMALSLDMVDKQEGTSSLSNGITGTAAANEQWFYNYGSASNWGGTNAGNLKIGMFLKSSVNTAATNFAWRDDDTAGLISPLDIVNLPVLAADTWIYTSATLGAATRPSIRSYGYRYNTDIGAGIFKIDSLSAIFDAADAMTNWGGSSGNVTVQLITNAAGHKEGTGALRCAFAAAAVAGDKCRRNSSTTFTAGPGTAISFWASSSVALSAGDLQWMDDSSATLNSPEDTVNLPAIPANTWTYVTLRAANSANKAFRSYGFNQAVDKGAFRLEIDALGKEINNMSSTGGWNAPGAGQKVFFDASTKHEGAGALRNDITASSSANDKWYQTFGSARDWSGYSTVGFWIRSTVGVAAGNLKFEYAAANDLSNPAGSLNIGALAANTWTYQKLSLTGARANINSYGINYAADIGAASIFLDDVLAGPGSPTFPGGGVINVRLLSLSNGQTVGVAYGKFGGSSGASAPLIATTSTFTTQSRMSDSGVLTNINISPAVSVNNPVPAAISISPISKIVGDNQFTLTVNGANFVNGSIVRFNGSERATSYVSANQLTATILAADLLVATTTAQITVFTNTPGGGASNAQIFTIDPLPLPAVKFVILQPANGTVDAPITVVVQAQNASNTLVTAYQSDVSLSAGGSATGGGLVDIINGVGTTTVSDTVAETVHLSLFDSQSTGLNASSTREAIFAGGVPAQFILNDPGDAAAGARTGYTVARKDQYGNLTTQGNSAVYLYSNSSGANNKFFNAESGGGVITSIIIDSGSSDADFWYYDEKAGSFLITASDNPIFPDGAAGMADAADTIAISAGSASQFILNNPGGEMIAGARKGYTVSRFDQFNNPASSSGTVVYLYSDSAGLNKKFYDAPDNGNIIGSITISNGFPSADFWYYDEKAGSFTVTASDNPAAPDGTAGIDDASADVAVSPAAAFKFILSDPGDMTASTSLGYAVARQDQFDNPVVSGLNTIYLYTNSGGGNAKFYDGATTSSNVIASIGIGNGSSSADFWYFDGEPGAWTITCSDNSVSPDGADGIIDGVDEVAVSAAPIVASKFIIVDPTDGIAGDNIVVTVKAVDNRGNIDASYQNDVTLAADGSATGGGLVDIINGVGTRTITDNTAQTVNLSLSDTQSAGLDVSSVQDVIFSAGSAAKFVMTGSSGLVAGNRFGYTVTRQDSFGNPVTSGNTPVHLYSDSNSGQGKFYDELSGGNIITSINIISSSSSANFWYYETKTGNWVISASDNAVLPDGSAGILDAADILVVASAPLFQFVLNNPGDMTSGTRLGYAVEREDRFANAVIAGDSSIYLYSSSTGTSTAFYAAASGGSPITNIQLSSGTSTGIFWYYDNTPGTWAISASDNPIAPDGDAGVVDAVDLITVDSSATVAEKLVILNPADGIAGQNMAITVEAQNNLGNIDTSYQDDVTLVAGGSAAGGGLVDIVNGVGVKIITDPISETIILSLSDTQGTGLDVSSTQSAVFTLSRSVSGSAGGSTIIAPPAPEFSLTISGQAYPEAQIVLKEKDPAGAFVVKKTIEADPRGNFTLVDTDLAKNKYVFTVVAKDKAGRQTQAKIYEADFTAADNISNYFFVPPTAGLTRAAVTRGDFIKVVGYAYPGNKVIVQTDSGATYNTVAGDNGAYQLLINTAGMPYGSHSVRAKQQSAELNQDSNFSLTRNFLVAATTVPKADFNGDGKIDVRDWSVFMSLFRQQDKQVDLNGDGKVDISDLSVMLRTVIIK
jgi:hypothetical protein